MVIRVLQSVMVVFSCALVLTLVCPAIAQDAEKTYSSLEITAADLQKESAEKIKILGVLKGASTLNDADRKAFDRFFKQYFFPRLTQPDRLGKLAADRKEFLDYAKRTEAQGVHEELVKTALEQLKQISAGPDFHPAIRCNAMLLIGELNKIESPNFGTPAEPYWDALKPMSDALNDPKQIDAVRAAAMVGILRFAEREGETDVQEIPFADVKQPLTNLMLQILDGTKPDGERSPGGQLWLQRRAVDVLGAFGDVGADNKIAKALDAIVGDDKAPLSLRCGAAVALGRLELAGGSLADQQATVKGLASIASKATHEQIRWLNGQQVRYSGAESKAATVLGSASPADSGDDVGSEDDFSDDAADGGGEDFGEFGGGGLENAGPPPSPLPYRERYLVELTQRRLLQQLECVRRGFEGSYRKDRGVAKLSADDYLKEVQTNLKTLVDTAKKYKSKNDEVAPKKELQTMIDDLTSNVVAFDAAAKITVVAPAAPATPAGSPDDTPAAAPDAKPPADVPSAPAAAPPGDLPAAVPK